MAPSKPVWSRRAFLTSAGMAPLGAAVAGRSESAFPAAADEGIYERLSLRPLINAAGTYTALSGSLILPEVAAAMAEAAKRYVSIPELQEAAGEHLASLLGAEAVLVTSGCAAALTHATAACVCGKDEEAIRRVPDVSGLKNEVIFQRSHRFSYDHAIRNLGVTIVNAETRRELEAAVNERTAMLCFLNFANGRGQIEREEFAALGKKHGVPTLIDAAADLPPASNLKAYTEMGFDLVAFSGGKGLRGPQCSGLLIGRKDLIEAAFLNGSPHSNSIARAAKVGKEEIVGLTRAVELYLERDHAADWKEWESRVQGILDSVQDIEGVEGERFVPEIANAVPHARLKWAPERIPLTRQGFAEALRQGEPRIEPRPSAPDDPVLEIGVWMMEPGEHEIAASRCREILLDATA